MSNINCSVTGWSVEVQPWGIRANVMYLRKGQAYVVIDRLRDSLSLTPTQVEDIKLQILEAWVKGKLPFITTRNTSLEFSDKTYHGEEIFVDVIDDAKKLIT